MARGKKTSPLSNLPARKARSLPPELPRVGADYWSRWLQNVPADAVKTGMLAICTQIVEYPSAKTLLQKGKFEELVVFADLIYNTDCNQAKNASSRQLTKSHQGRKALQLTLSSNLLSYASALANILDNISELDETQKQPVRHEIQQIMRDVAPNRKLNYLHLAKKANDLQLSMGKLLQNVTKYTQTDIQKHHNKMIDEFRHNLIVNLNKYHEGFLSWPLELQDQLRNELKSIDLK